MKLSIITINYNNRDGLERTAKSIVEQTCQDYEWIVIDGGSTDGSVDVIKKYADNITYWVSEPDKGIYNAMNKGVDRATGDYLHMLNSGDYYYSPDIIESFYAQNFNADVVHATVQVVDRNCNPRILSERAEITEPSMFFDGNFCQQALFYNKRCFQNHRFDESYTITADRKFNIELLFKNYVFKKWRKIVTCFDNMGISSTNENLRVKEGFRSQVEAFPPEFLVDYCHRLYAENKSLHKELLTFDNDIHKKTSIIVKGHRIWRIALRVILYPISFLASK